MKPLRKNVAIAIDGGGIKGIIVTRALSMLEEALGVSVHDIFRLAVGTSTGSIISAGIASGLSAEYLHELYTQLGKYVFPYTLRKAFFPLTRYRYSPEPFRELLNTYFGFRKVGDFWITQPQTDLVITTYDLQENRTRFIKPWKKEYEDWLLVDALQASCTVPTYFPVAKGRYIDGGVGSYANPCYIAAYEAIECLQWDPLETTLISIGTGRDPYSFTSSQRSRWLPWHWIGKVLGVFLQSAYDQQVHLVDTYFEELDFRRFQVDLHESIEMDDTSKITRLEEYGSQLGEMILQDQVDRSQGVEIKQPIHISMGSA